MKNFFYFFLWVFFLASELFSNELDEELIDKKFNQIKTSEFCTTEEWNKIEKEDFVKAFILGWYWETKEINKSEKIDKQRLNKLINETCLKKGVLIDDLENVILKNTLKKFYFTGHDWIKLDLQRKKVFIKGYNAGLKSNNDENKRRIVKYNVLFSRLSDYYFYTNHRDETVGLSIKTIVDQIFGHLDVE